MKVKRLFDIVRSLIGLILLLPAFLIVAAAIKLTSRGPVFFRQKRVGLNFKPFYIYKFRTMVKDAETKGYQITAGGDPRITGVGKVLRKTKLDELPQLINVLKGDMSLVGPRPEVQKYVDLYRADYEEILKMRPGITDISSLMFRNEEGVLGNQPDPERFYRETLLPEKIKLAREYIERCGFSFDVSLILKTVYRIVRPLHSHQELTCREE